MVNKWLKKIIYGIAFVAIAAVLLFNIVYINNIDNGEFSSIERESILHLIFSIIIAIGIVIISYSICKLKIEIKIKKIVLIIGLLLYAGIQVIWIHQAIALPYADSDQVLIIARGMIEKGELNPYCFMYIQYYPQQLTLATVIAFIFKIFNTTNHIILQYINVIANIFTVCGLYSILKSLSKEYKINKILFFIMITTFVPIILLSNFVYGDFIGLAFVIWATEFAIKYTKTKKKRNIILTGILMSIACLVRMNYFIFAIAIVIYLGINLLETKSNNYKEIGISVILLVIFIAIIFIPNNVIKTVYQKKYNLSAEKSFSTIPYLYMGIIEGERGNGWYNSEIGSMVYHMMCDEKDEAENINQQCVQAFKERIQYLVENPIYTVKYYSKKIISMWAEPTMEFGYYNSTYLEGTNLEEHRLVKTVIEGKAHTILKIYQKGLTILILFGAICAIFINRKRLDKNVLLLCLIFLGGFTFHLFWEAKSRYILPYVIILIPTATLGITKVVEELEMKIKEKVKKQKS